MSARTGDVAHQAQVAIRRAGGQYVLETEQYFDRPPDALFPFFADAANLARITPPWLNFEILTPTPITMQQGTSIDYRIRLYGVPINWRTRVTVWQPPRKFVDTQVRGPYRVWIHEHHLEAAHGGTIMRDRVTFRSRGPGLLAPLIHRLFVNGRVRRIFAYRRQVLAEIFPAHGRPSREHPLIST